MTVPTPQPTRFEIDIDAAELEGLRRRLVNARWPPDNPGSGWDRGVDLEQLRSLVEHWRLRYDWRRHEAAMNRLAHYLVDLDGCRIHFIHEPGRGKEPMPLLLSHGWPGSFYEYSKLIPLLTDPGGHGADPVDAFDVVVPSLPGYGFSDRLPPPLTFNAVPGLFGRLMTEVLGYQRFSAHGSDIGAMVTNRLALEQRDHLLAIHVTFPPEPAFGAGTPDPSPAERAILEKRRGAAYWGSGYTHFGATRPHTLGAALADSPVGLAAFMVDKIREWADCEGELSRRFTVDELLTWISLYWLSGSAASSLDPYWDWALGSAGIPSAWKRREPPRGVDSVPLRPGEEITVPAALAVFERGPVKVPREWAERSYADLRRWTEYGHGGHFPAWEEPELLADELRGFFRAFR